MSFKSREKKRRAKAAGATAGSRYPERLVPDDVSRKCCCNRYGLTLQEGGACYYATARR